GVSRGAVGVALGVVHHDADDVAGIVGGGHAGEGDPVDVVEVATAAGVDLLGGSGLAGDLIAGHPGGRPGALLVPHRVALDDGAQHAPHGLRRLRRHHPDTLRAGFFGAGAVGCNGGVDDPRRY